MIHKHVLICSYEIKMFSRQYIDSIRNRQPFSLLTFAFLLSKMSISLPVRINNMRYILSNIDSLYTYLMIFGNDFATFCALMTQHDQTLQEGARDCSSEIGIQAAHLCMHKLHRSNKKGITIVINTSINIVGIVKTTVRFIESILAVSYTHLDVYKRQVLSYALRGVGQGIDAAYTVLVSAL